MPEHQASSSPPPPPPPDAHGPSDRDPTAPSPPETAQKRTYLSLLPSSHLIDLILAIDANPQTLIFPHDLHTAIGALQGSQRTPTPSAAKDPPPAATVTVKAEPLIMTVPSPQPTGSQTPLINPPQYAPPARYYPYNHTPYYPPQIQSHPPPAAHVSPPSAPRRNPLFTSTPLTRDLNKALLPHPPPPPPVSSRDDPNAMPSYEEMLVEAILDVGEADGTAPKTLFGWMASHYPLQQNFRPSASQALHKALKRGRLEKIGGKYRLNPTWGGGPTTSKRATRRPTPNNTLSPHGHSQVHPHLLGYDSYSRDNNCIPSHPLPHRHMEGAPYAHIHPPPHAPHAFPPYIQPHPSIPPPDVIVPSTAEENDVMEAEETDGHDDANVPVDEDKGHAESVKSVSADEIRHSLLRLAEALRRVATKGGAG